MLKSQVTEIILAAMYLRHGFSIEALTDQLKLMKIVAPFLSGGVFDSPYKFLKKYDEEWIEETIFVPQVLRRVGMRRKDGESSQ